MQLTKREGWLFLGITALFLLLRLPAVFTPYHQDEYKWPLYAEEIVYKAGSIPHPPLTEFIYRVVGKHIGLDNFRFIPLTFGFFNLFLLFYLVKSLADKKTAFWAIGLFTVSFYSVLANLMVDVDGSVMPFFFLLMVIGYYKLKNQNFIIGKSNWFWLGLFLVGLVLGFLIKVSFFLGILALAFDFVLTKNIFADRKTTFKYLGYFGLGILALGLLLIGVKFLFPFFDLTKAVKYWEHFAVFSGRGWTQTFIQFVKSIMYISPLFILSWFFVDREIWQKTRAMFFFLFFGTIFYLLVFDFSLGAIDRYFQFAVIPTSIVSAFIFAKNFAVKEKIKFLDYFIVGLFGVAIFLLQFINHLVPPLYPKTEWLAKIWHLQWNFLFPFMGGSGPIPFYVSFLFIVLVWLLALVFVIFGFRKNEVKKRTLFALLILGILYNGVFVEEYLFGRINGNTKKLVSESVTFIKAHSEIKKVIVYNDTGGYNVRQSGKYYRRMYATPQFEAEYQKILADYDGYILFIDIPRIDSNSFYAQYFAKCKKIFNASDRQINAQIFDCQK